VARVNQAKLAACQLSRPAGGDEPSKAAFGIRGLGR